MLSTILLVLYTSTLCFVLGVCIGALVTRHGLKDAPLKRPAEEKRDIELTAEEIAKIEAEAKRIETERRQMSAFWNYTGDTPKNDARQP